MNKEPSVICFSLPETQVDELIELTRESALKESRWIVFGHDMNRLGGLVALWQHSVELTIVHMQRADADFLDAALSILRAEEVTLPNSIWLQGETPGVPMQEYPNSAQLFNDVGADEKLQVLLQLWHRASSAD